MVNDDLLYWIHIQQTGECDENDFIVNHDVFFFYYSSKKLE